MPRQAASSRRRAVAPPRSAARRAPIRRVAPIRQPVMKVSNPARSQVGSAFRSVGATGGTMLGSALGGPAGGAIGGVLGRGAGALLSKIFGHGDYAVSNVGQVKENSIVLSNAANIPEFVTGRVSVKFKHREYLGDVISSATPGAFKIDSYAINPGLSSSYPWLSGVVGANFQQYRINGQTYEFRSMSSDALNSTNTALGQVIMATDYDSPDAQFTSKQQMENTEYGVSCKPSVNMMHAIECARGQTPVSELYIRAYNNPANTDIRLYDLGRFSIATNGCQGSSVNLGELWVTYDIDAFKAIEQPPGYSIPVADYVIAGGGSDLKIDLNGHPFGNSPVDPGYVKNIDLIGLTVSGTTIVFPSTLPAGTAFNVSYYVQGDSTACVQGAWNGSNGLNVDTRFTMPDLTTTKVIWTLAAYYDGTGSPASPPTLSWAGTTLPANVTYAEVSLSQLGALYYGPG